MRKIGSEAKLVLVLYGPSFRGASTEILSRWWKEQERFLSQLGLRITHVYGKFEQKPRRMNNSVAYPYRRYQERFWEELARGNVRTLVLETMESRPDAYTAFDWDAECEIVEDKDGVLSGVGIDIRYVPALGADLVDSLGKSILEMADWCIKPAYGLCTVMPRDFMPSGYVLGIVASKAPRMLVHDAGTWDRWARRECARHLRNVHAVNVLNDSHLHLPVGEECLGDWIRASPERGELTGLGENLTLWSLVGDEESVDALRWDAPRVQAVREDLMKYDFFPWQRELRTK